jgi:hypothetical protein
MPRPGCASGRLPFVRPVWADDLQFDITRHVTAVPASGPVSRSALERNVADLMTRRLDRPSRSGTSTWSRN